MKNRCRILVMVAVIVSLFGLLGFSTLQAREDKTVEEEILDILRKKGTISGEKYEALKKRAEKEKAAEVKNAAVRFKKGFSLETPDGNFKLQPYMKLRVQFKAFEAHHPGKNNDFHMRHARVGLKGTIYKYYDFNISGEFGKGNSDLWDGYMGYNYWSEARLRIGQFKQPFSLEWSSSCDWRDFIEMPLPIDNLTPDRDIGAMIHGDIGKGLLNYGIAICNGSGKNTSDDTDDDKDVVARVVLSPFADSENTFLKGLHLGGSVAYGREEMKRDKMRWKGKFQTAGGTNFFQLKNNDILHDGVRTRYGAELCYMVGPFSLKGEWVRMDLDDLYLNEGGSKDDFHVDGGYVSVSYILTGEHQPFKNGKYGRITPRENFDPRKGTWGALQLVARYETLSIDDDLLKMGYADAAKYTDDANGFTVGVNWYLNEMVRLMLDYNRTEFDDNIKVGGRKIDNEDVVLGRVQFVF